MAPGLKGTSGQIAAPPYTLGNYTWDAKVNFRGLGNTPTEYTASGAINSKDSFVQLNSSGAALAMTMPAPVEGRHLIITHKDVSTSSHAVTLAAGTFDGTNDVATFDAENETLVLVGLSATRYAVVENIGSVAFS